MSDTMNKLNALLSDPSFYEENKNLKNPEEIIKAIQVKVPEATAEEIDQLLSSVSEQLQQREEALNDEELESVAGGFAVTITAAGVIAAVKFAAAAGTVIGGAIWYWKHRKCI